MKTQLQNCSEKMQKRGLKPAFILAQNKPHGDRRIKGNGH